MTGSTSPVARILNLVKLERKEISAVYFYAILNGLILLAIPVGIQSLVGFAQTNTASASIIVLIILIVVSVFTAGVLQIKQMQLIEKIQQKIFVRYSFDIAQQIPQIQLSAVDNYYLPELLNRFFDIPNLQKSLAKLLLDFPLAIIQIIFGLLLLSFYHPVFIALDYCFYWLFQASFISQAVKDYKPVLKKAITNTKQQTGFRKWPEQYAL